MGVIRNNYPRARLIDQITIDDYIFDDESDVELEHDTNNNLSTVEEVDNDDVGGNHMITRRRRQKVGRVGRKTRKMNDLTGDVIQTKNKEKMGARKQRRYENARLLYSSVDPSDICEDYSDIVQSTVTALSKLFMEQQNMEAWNNFIEKDEDGQRDFLNNIEAEKMHQQHCCCSFDDPSPRGAGIFENLTLKHYPAHSAEVSYSRLNRRFRSILNQKSLPLDFMAKIEEELREFFLNNRTQKSEWSSCILSRLKRMLIHALSQYLCLFSKSVIVRDGSSEKYVKVRNKWCSFKPPPENLVDYLKRTRTTENADIS